MQLFYFNTKINKTKELLMPRIPDIRLYKAAYSSEEAKEISKEKGSVVYSSKTKRVYVGGKQYGSCIQDIRWLPDTNKNEYTLQIERVEENDITSIKWNPNKATVTVSDKGKVNELSIAAAINSQNIKIKGDITSRVLNYNSPDFGNQYVTIKNGDSVSTALKKILDKLDETFTWTEFE